MENVINKIINAKSSYEVFDIKNSLDKIDKALLKKLYHKLSLKVHPDKNSDVRANDAFKKLNESYTALKEDKNINYGSKVSSQSSQSNNFTQFSGFNFFQSGGFNFFYQEFYYNPSSNTYQNSNTFSSKNNFKNSNTSSKNSNTSSSKNNSKNSSKNSEKKEAKKCNGKTQTGSPCKNNAKEDSMYCRMHQDFNPSTFTPMAKKNKNTKCSGTTKNGEKCKKFAQDNSNFCNIHTPE